MKIYTKHPHSQPHLSIIKLLWLNIARRKIMLLSLIVLAIGLPLLYLTFKYQSKTEAAWFDGGWLYRKKMTFNNSAQASNLSNFPVLVTLSASNFDFSLVQDNGEDIRFTDSDGTTQLSFEIKKYDKTNQQALIWVNVPQIDASSLTDFIYIYYGNINANDGQNADGTWNSNYKGVYHLDDNAASTTVVDSSGNGNDLTTAENTTKFASSSAQINSSFVTAGTPTKIINQDGSYSELYPDIELDSNGYPVITYMDYTDGDLILVHCNDKDCKGNDESLQVVYSTGTTGYYPSLKLDTNGYPVIAFYDGSGGNLMLAHCNDVNCAGGDDSVNTIESTNDTGYYPSLQIDTNGYPVISYYYGTGADLKLAHCNDVNCAGSNETINTIDSTGTVGNYANGNSLILDGSGYPVIAYNDDTNNDLKIAHCNDVDCAGSNESLTAPLSASADDSGLYSKALQLDASGYPMVSFMNSVSSTYYSTYLHCDDVNCAGDEVANRVTIYATTAYYSDMKKSSAGNPIFFILSSNVYPYVATCTSTACSSITGTILTYYSQYASSGPSLALDSNNNIYAVSYNLGEDGIYDSILYTTESKIAGSYDSDFNFGTGNFSASLWFKNNADVQQNFLLSRYDTDQGYKIWLNYAGQPCFGIDDDASWGPDDYACTTPASITQNVDNGQGGSVTHVDFVLDSSGYPVIAYYDDSPDDLEIVHCNDANCSGGNETTAAVDTSANSVGQFPSIKLDTSGYPVIAYYDATDTNLKVVHCGNANCSSGNTINAIDVNVATSVGAYPSLQLDGNGYPVIGYYDTTNTAIKLVHCNDVNCSGGDESIVTVDNTEYDIPYLTTTWLQLDDSGYPVMAYTNLTSYDLKIAHCTDANCTGVTLNTPDTSGTTGYYPSLQLDGSDYPVVAYQYPSGGNLRLMHCNDVNCAGGNETFSTFPTETLGYSGTYYVDLDLTSAGYPVITHTQLADWNILVTVCNDVNCAGSDETTSQIREDPYNYVYASLELDTNNYPVVLTRRAGDLGLLHFSNTTSYTDTNRADTNTWHHLVAVKTGTTSLSLYLDGVLVASDVAISATGTLTSDSAGLHLSEDFINGLSAYNWRGQIDEVQIDSTARSAAWVAAQYLSETDNFITFEASEEKDQPKAYWKFDEGSGLNASNSTWSNLGTTTNLNTNPSLETNQTGWTCWVNSGAGTCAVSTDTSAFGVKSLKSIMTVSGEIGHSSGATAVTGSNTYSVSGWIKVTSWGGSNFAVYMREWYPGGNGQCGTTMYTASGVTNGWVKFSGTCTVRADSTSLSVSYYLNNTAQTVYVDGIQIEQTSAPTKYCDGSLTTGNGSHSWTGTAHASTSTCDTGSDGDISGATWQNEDQCVSDKCLYFNGTNSYVDVGRVTPVSGESQITAEAWINPTTINPSGGEARIFSRGTNDILFQVITGGKLNVYLNNGGNIQTDANAVQANVWQHVAFVWETTTDSIAIYVNGKVVKTDTLSTSTIANTGNMFIGRYTASVTGLFKGFIDEPKIYNYARSAAQIKADYDVKGAGVAKGASVQIGTNVKNSDAFSNGLLGYWKMDETTGDASDSSGNSVTLTNQGSTTFSAGKFANASVYNGSSQYFNTGSTISGIKTVAFWVYPSNTTDNYLNLVSGTYLTSSSGTVSATGFTTPLIYVNGTLNGTVSASTWNHVVVTTETAINANAFEVGRANAAYFKDTGKMDEVRVFNRVLAPKEIRDLYAWAPGPVGYWNMDENTGTTLNDTSGNGKNGFFSGSPTWTQGKYGGGLSVSSSNNATITDDALHQMKSNGWTVSSWIKTTSNTTYILRKITGQEWYYQYVNPSGYLQCGTKDGTTEVYVNSTNKTINDNSWHFASCVWDRESNLLRNYVDGVQITTTSISSLGSVDNAGTLTLGESVTGIIDDVRIYNYARSPKQIAEDMNAGHPAGGSPVGSQVGYWKLDEGYGNSLNNSGTVGSAINGNMGVGTSSPTWTNNGKYNKALSFDGNDYVSAPDNLAFDIDQTGFTYSAWINPSTLNATYNMFMGHYLPYFDVNGSNSNKLHMSMYAAGAQRSVNGNTIITTDQWYYATATYDDLGYMKVYLNGRLDGTAGPFLIPTNYDSSQYIGTWSNSLTYPFNGLIDEVKVYNYALTEDEIKTDYNRGQTLVLGAMGDNSSYDKQAANQEFCVPGDTTSCAAPVGEWKMDEKTGTTANDTSSNGRNVSFTNSPTWISAGQCKQGACLDFDNDDYVSNDWTDFSLGPQTIEFWMNADTVTAGWHDLLGTTLNSDVNRFHLDTTDQSIVFYSVLGACGTLDSGVIPTAGQWYHVAGTTDGSLMKIFINGQQKNSAACVTASYTSTGVFIGGTTEDFDGKIDQVRIFAYARTPAQIAYDYNRGAPVGHWKFDECQNQTANDSSGNGNSGTITVGATGSQNIVGACSLGVGSSSPWGNGVTGKYNASLNFDGTDDYVSRADQGASDPLRLNNSTGLTISQWINPTGTYGTFNGLVTKGGSNSGYILRFSSSGAAVNARIGNGTTYEDLNLTRSFTSGVWSHLIFIFNGTTYSYYVNGSYAGGGNSSLGFIAGYATTLYIGNDEGQASRYFSGQIDDVKIFNYALTAEQVKSLYNAGAAVQFAPATGSP